MTSHRSILTSAGIGLRLPHMAEVVATHPAVGWLEVHPENLLSNPHAMELLTELAGHYPVSVHTVGISVGSATGIDRKHLARLRGLIDRIHPVLLSGHLAWSTARDEYLNDLLPLPYNAETLGLVERHVKEVEDAFGCRYLIENPSSYVGFRDSTMTEPEFLSELAGRTGCGLLCDVSNVVVSAHNMGYNPHAYLDGLPLEAIEQIHLGGFTPEEDETGSGEELWIDTHAAAIAAQSWDLYRYALRRFGWRPTLIEWDADLPELAHLAAEAAKADGIARETPAMEDRYADAC